MKNILFALFILSFLAGKAQQADNCVLVLNGKELSTEDVITKDDAAHFCTLLFRDYVTKKDLLPTAFDWVASNNGQIIKGNLTDCIRLMEAAKGMASGDVLYIQEIKYKGIKGQCKGQFTLRIK